MPPSSPDLVLTASFWACAQHRWHLTVCASFMKRVPEPKGWLGMRSGSEWGGAASEVRDGYNVKADFPFLMLPTELELKLNWNDPERSFYSGIEIRERSRVRELSSKMFRTQPEQRTITTRRKASDFNCFLNYLLIALMEKVEKVERRDPWLLRGKDKLIFSG